MAETPPKTNLIDFTICGQKFRLRATDDDARRIRKVASEIERLVHERRSGGANSDFRAALMVAYELGFDYNRLADENRRFKQGAEKALAPAQEIAERLIGRIDNELDAAPGGE
ncbi:cell division protein ZapA [Candidatus Sumerlaeota bacterium]|nr:cell division protein ZapA [Candidatus Sumerlaeota bacterium]